MNINQKIKKAKIKLFRKDIGLILFGACAYKFDWYVHQMPDFAEGYVKFALDSSSSVDGMIHINENMIQKDDYTHDNLIALIIHELLHILQKHGRRRGNREPKLWNFATDHVIDRDLKKLGLNPYQNRFNIIQELDQAKPNCSAEEAYDWINSKAQRFTIKMNSSSGDGNGDSQSFTVTDEQTGQEYQVTFTADDNAQLSEADKEKLKQKTDQFISEARALNQTMKEKGSMSGGMQDYLDKLLKVEIDWASLLEKAIKTNTILRPIERSWRKLNHFYSPHGMTLPGMSMDEEKENVGMLIILLDTSASISYDELKKFGYIVNRSLGYFSTVKLITHDTVIHQNIDFEKEDHNKFYGFIKSMGFKGRGGTSHRDCFKYIEDEIWSDNEKRDILSMVISLTDMHSDIEGLYGSFKWIKNNTPLVFLSTSQKEIEDVDFPNINTIKIK